MRNLLLTKFCLIVALLLSTTESINFAAVDSRQDKRERALKLWEKVITAKGGRERLHAVRNLYVQQEFKSCPDCVRDNLYVFPDKIWSFFMSSPNSVSPSKDITVIDYGLRACWSSHWNSEKGSTDGIRCIVKAGDQSKLEIIAQQWSLLLETNWLRPTPMEARSGWMGLRRVDIVRVRFDLSSEGILNYSGLMVDYYLDKKSHLPLKTALKWDGEDEGGWKEGGTFYGDYVDVNGIKLPRRITPDAPLFADPEHKESKKYDYRINVDYEEGIFSRPPSSNMNREAWRKSR